MGEDELFRVFTSGLRETTKFGGGENINSIRKDSRASEGEEVVKKECNGGSYSEKGDIIVGVRGEGRHSC